VVVVSVRGELHCYDDRDAAGMVGAMHIEVAVTAIVFNSEGRALITKRSTNKKRFPGLWTVPGGHFEHQDILLRRC
jgi:isopentenyldiphosphate isomerase